ncbi:MAG: hypothetical protein ABWY00_18290 [Dongiaceae bacterium]
MVVTGVTRRNWSEFRRVNISARAVIRAGWAVSVALGVQAIGAGSSAGKIVEILMEDAMSRFHILSGLMK